MAPRCTCPTCLTVRNIGRIVYVSNTGVAAVTGEVDVYANGSMFTCDLGSLAARTVTQLSAVLDACVAGRGITSGKVAFLMTFIARDVDIEVYSAYNVNSMDRGTVINTSNGVGCRTSRGSTINKTQSLT